MVYFVSLAICALLSAPVMFASIEAWGLWGLVVGVPVALCLSFAPLGIDQFVSTRRIRR